MDKGYCLMCGNLRDVYGGVCRQCQEDARVTRNASLPAGHPMSFEVDEIRPASRGGSVIDPANVAPAHRICNERRGNKSVADMKAAAGPRPRDVGCKTSRRW